MTFQRTQEYNLIFERTQDYDLIRGIMAHPRIYPHISDDGCPPATEFRPIEHPGVWYVLVRHQGELLGLFVFTPQGAACWEVHTCLLPHAWGRLARLAAAMMARWIWEHTPCRRIVTTVPVYNRLALRFAEEAGMTEYGRNPKAWLKHGKLYDTILLGMSRPKDQEV